MLASVCSVMLATAVVKCADPVSFEVARREVERRSVAQAEFFNPELDAYFFLKPIVKERVMPASALARSAEEEDPLWRYHSPTHPNPRGAVLRGSMAPIP